MFSMDVVRFMVQRYFVYSNGEKTLQEHCHAIQFEDAGEPDCADLAGGEDLELLCAFVEVVTQRDGIV